jgi:hypothetical protein
LERRGFAFQLGRGNKHFKLAKVDLQFGLRKLVSRIYEFYLRVYALLKPLFYEMEIASGGPELLLRGLKVLLRDKKIV